MTVAITTISKGDTLDMQSVSILQWKTMANGDTGAAAQISNFSDRSVQVTGTFGAAGNVIIEGSNDGTNYYTLNDPFNTTLGTITSATLKGIIEACRYIRPRVSAGDGTTSLTVTLFARGNIKP